MLLLRSNEDRKHQYTMRVSAKKNKFVTTVRIIFFLHETSHPRWMCSTVDATIVTQLCETRLFYMYVITYSCPNLDAEFAYLCKMSPGIIFSIHIVIIINVDAPHIPGCHLSQCVIYDNDCIIPVKATLGGIKYWHLKPIFL